MDVIDRSPRTDLFPAPPVENGQPPASVPGNDGPAGGRDFFQGLSEATAAPATAPATPAPQSTESTPPNVAPLPGPSANGAVAPPGTKSPSVVPTAADTAAEVLAALDAVDTLLTAEISASQAVVIPVGPAQQTAAVPSGLLSALESGGHRSAEKSALRDDDQDPAATTVSPVVIAAIFQPPAFTVPEPVVATPGATRLNLQAGVDGQLAGPIAPATPGVNAPTAAAINTAPLTNVAAIPATGTNPTSDTSSDSQRQSPELPAPDRVPVTVPAPGKQLTAPVPVAPSAVARSTSKPAAVVEPQAPPVTVASPQSRTTPAITGPKPTAIPQPAPSPVETQGITPAPRTPAPVVVTAQIPPNVPRFVAPPPTNSVRTTTPADSEAAVLTPIPAVTVSVPVPEVASVVSPVVAPEPTAVTESAPVIARQAVPVATVKLQPTRPEPVVSKDDEPIAATPSVAPRRQDRAPGIAASFLQALAKLGPIVSVRAQTSSRDEEPTPAADADDSAVSATASNLGARPAPLSTTAATIPPLPLAEPTQLVHHLSEAVHTASQTGQQLSLRVTPEQYGPIVVHVRLEAGQLTARVETHSALAHQVLSDSLPQLVDALTARGTAVDRIDVVPIDPRNTDFARDDRLRDSLSDRSSWGSGTSAGTQSDPQTPDRRRAPPTPPPLPLQPSRESASEVTTVTAQPERLQALNLRV